MTRQTVKVEGLREAEAALEALGKSLGRGVLRRVAKRALQPIAEDARAAVEASTEGTGDLSESIAVSGSLSKAQKKDARGDTKSFVEMHVGAGSLTQAITQEFGTGERFQKKSGKSVGSVVAEPFMRPAWDAHKAGLPAQVGADLWADIEKTAARKAKRDAKKAG